MVYPGEALFASKLHNLRGINIKKGVDGVPIRGLDDWLVARAGGDVGYIAEMFIENAEGILN